MNLRHALRHQNPTAPCILLPDVPDWREQKYLAEMQATELVTPDQIPLIGRKRREFSPLLNADGRAVRRYPASQMRKQGGWLQGANESLIAAQVAGTLFNTFTTAKTVLPVGCLYDLPKNWFYLGRLLRQTVIGGFSNRVTGPDTTTFQLMMTAVVAFTSGVLNLTTTAHTTLPFWGQCTATCRAVGATTTANLMGQWIVAGQMFAASASQADSAASHGFLMGPNTAPAVGTGFDSTAVQTVDFFNAQSVSNAGNGIQVHQYLLEACP